VTGPPGQRDLSGGFAILILEARGLALLTADPKRASANAGTTDAGGDSAALSTAAARHGALGFAALRVVAAQLVGGPADRERIETEPWIGRCAGSALADKEPERAAAEGQRELVVTSARER
jgi:hypothetical protein